MSFDTDICYVVIVMLVFFFKQKTAYEVRISDWSSDVCSSDLRGGQDRTRAPPAGRGSARGRGDQLREPQVGAADGGQRRGHGGHSAQEIGRASCRERVCQYV